MYQTYRSEHPLAHPEILHKGSYLVGLSLHDTSPGKNQVRSASRPYIPDFLEQGANLRLRLVEPIQAGDYHLSQVWLCSYASPGQQASSDVVLKLFQESLRPPQSSFDYVPVQDDIRRESRAYQQLRDLQGSVLPYSYGFYSFTLPCGEKTIGHVMEFIPGDQLDKHAREIHDLDKLQELFISALSAINTVHQYEVMHADIKSRNIIVMDPVNIVLVDFGSSNIFADIRQGFHRYDIHDLVVACIPVSKLAKAARTWIAKHLNHPMLEGLRYEIVPYMPWHTEDDNPMIALCQEENVSVPVISDTEEVVVL